MNAPPASPPSLCVSVVLYHSQPERLEETLVTLLLAAEEARSIGVLASITLAVIDNSVCGDYHQAVQQRLAAQPWAEAAVHCELLRMACNAGYGAGHNEAFKRYPADIHLILNPDVALAPEALRLGLEYLRDHPQTALVCPRGEAGDGRSAHLSKRLPTVLVLALRAFAPSWLAQPFAAQLAHYEMHDMQAAGQPAAVPLASGCFMLVRGAALRAVGGFDEAYFLYFEDFDLSLRLAEQGAVEYLPTMQVRHYGGGSAAKGWRHRWWFLRSGIRFFGDHGWRWF